VKNVLFCAAHKFWYCHWQEPKGSRLNPRVKQYLDKAEECERLAAQARNPDAKAIFAEIARVWRVLARQIGQWERDRD
jgi:hypothetical protein